MQAPGDEKGYAFRLPVWKMALVIAQNEFCRTNGDRPGGLSYDAIETMPLSRKPLIARP